MPNPKPKYPPQRALQAYLRTHSLSELAGPAQLSKSFLCQIASGQRRASVDAAIRIEDATQGLIRAAKLLGLR